MLSRSVAQVALDENVAGSSPAGLKEGTLSSFDLCITSYPSSSDSIFD